MSMDSIKISDKLNRISEWALLNDVGHIRYGDRTLFERCDDMKQSLYFLNSVNLKL